MLFTNYMHSKKYLFYQIVDEIYKNTLHKFETCMSSMHMRYKTNQIDDSIPFVRTHIEPMFAPSGPVSAPLAPGLRLCSAPVQSRSLRPSLQSQTFFLLPRFGPAPSLFFARPDSPRSSASARACPEPCVAPIPACSPFLPPVRARIAPLSSPPALLQSPCVRAPAKDAQP